MSQIFQTKAPLEKEEEKKHSRWMHFKRNRWLVMERVRVRSELVALPENRCRSKLIQRPSEVRGSGEGYHNSARWFFLSCTDKIPFVNQKSDPRLCRNENSSSNRLKSTAYFIQHIQQTDYVI